MLARLKNLWELSKYRPQDTYKNHANLIKTDTSPEEKKLITVVELDKPDMFPPEKTIEL